MTDGSNRIASYLRAYYWAGKKWQDCLRKYGPDDARTYDAWEDMQEIRKMGEVR